MSEREKWQPTDDPTMPRVSAHASTAPFFPASAGWVAAAVLAVALAGFAGWSFRNKDGALELRRSQDVVVAMRDLARLETSQFHIGNVVEVAGPAPEGLASIFNARDALILVAEADVVAGIDLAKVRPADIVVDDARRSVHVTLPAPEIFSAALDNARTRVWRHEREVLAEHSISLETQARQEAERMLRESAIQGGILRNAEEQAKRVVRSMWASAGFELIEINFATDEGF